MDGVLGKEEADRLQERLLYLAWRKYRIPLDVAEDVLQAALLTYLQVRDRYADPKEHPGILYGIFRNKCREHISREIRNDRGHRQLRAAVAAGIGDVPAALPRPTPEDGVLSDLVRREDARLIIEALAQVRPKAREMFRLIAEEGASRHDLIARYGLNKNTLDSRLHTYRQELREKLERRGLDT